VTPEHASLRRHLDAQRNHVLGAIEGLTEEQLRQPTLPSGWSCIELVRHLTLAGERYWFRSIIGGEGLDWLPEAPGADWRVPDGNLGEEVIAGYRNEIDRSNDVLARSLLDAAPRHSDPQWAEWGVQFPDVRSIALHLLTETATHAGHLDAARELLDGRQWRVLS
jgi:hypothetical protein